MAWSRIDDQFHAHPKVRQALHTSSASISLWALALSHSSAYLTDGHVSEAAAHMLLPAPRERQRAIGALVDAGLWMPCSGGWEFHHFLDFNEPAAAVLERRASRARAGGRPRAGASAQAGATPTPYPLPSKDVR